MATVNPATAKKMEKFGFERGFARAMAQGRKMTVNHTIKNPWTFEVRINKPIYAMTVEEMRDVAQKSGYNVYWEEEGVEIFFSKAFNRARKKAGFKMFYNFNPMRIFMNWVDTPF